MRTHTQELFSWFLKLILLIVILSVFLPLSPKMPAPGIDASWELGLNQAVAQGLSFGKDIIFTLGPYSSIYTKAYHPATDFMMIGGSFYLAFFYWVSLILIIKGAKWQWTVVFGIMLFGMIYSRDSLLFSYPLLIGLICFQKPELYKQNYFLVLFTLLLTPFGLMPLIKGSLLILCFTMMMLCAVFFMLNQKSKLAIICLISPFVSMVLFWIASGQAINNLPAYIINSLSIASGFTEAMATVGERTDLILFGLSSVCILIFILWQKQQDWFMKLFTAGAFLIFLFLSFKTGFTRYVGHAFIAGTSLMIAGFLLVYFYRNKLLIPLVLLSLSSSIYINSHDTQISLRNNFLSTYSAAWYGFKNRLLETGWLKQDFDLSMVYLRNQAAFPVLNGTTDVYSFNQSYLIASDMKWAPRPVFQSYSVFTPAMADKNYRYLANEKRPDNIIFKIEAIDDRLPSIEDGASWPALLSYYQPEEFNNEYLFLKKNNVRQSPPAHLLHSEHYSLGEWVQLPHHDDPLFAEIEIKPTFIGILAAFFFKPSQLTAQFKLNDGSQRQYRIIASMAKAGFLLSPLIEQTAEFGLLYHGKEYLTKKEVIAFKIEAMTLSPETWHHQYSIRFKTLSPTK